MKRFRVVISYILAVSIAFSGVTPALADTAESEHLTLSGAGHSTLPDAQYAASSDAQYAASYDTQYATPSDAMMTAALKSTAFGNGVLYEGYNWMSSLNGEMKVKNLTVPETHDAGAFNIHFARLDPAFDALAKGMKKKLQESLGSILGGITSLFQDALLNGIVKPVVNYLATAIQSKCGKCQSLTIEKQLNSGVRAFDLRFRYDGGKFYIYHGDKTKGYEGLFFTCECYDGSDDKTRLSLELVFQKIRDFLDTNEDEVIFLKVQNEGSVYNDEVEAELKELEKKYDICSDYAMRDGKGKAFSLLGEKKLSEVRGQVFDITDAIKDITGGSWEATVATKKKKIREAVDDNAMGLPGEIQCNIQMKVYYYLDPNDECHLHITPVYFTILGVKIPHDVIISFRDLFISPKQNADDINPWVHDLLKKVTESRQDNVAQNGLGLVSTDFMDRRMCWRIANVNSINEEWGPRFEFVEGGDDEPEEPEEPDEPENEECVIDLISLYNYNGCYEMIEGDGQKYKGSGDLSFKTDADSDEYIGTIVDDELIGLNGASFNEDNRTVTVRSGYLKKLSEGRHSIGIMFSGGVAFGEFTVSDTSSGYDSTDADVPSAAYSRYWQIDGSGSWIVKNSRGEPVANAWLCDDAVSANGLNVWYLLGSDGRMITDGLVQDSTGNFYSMETSHAGFFGSIRYIDGIYDCSGQSVYLEFNRNHDGSFGAITNPEGIEALKAIYGIKKYNTGNENAVYTSGF